MVYDDHTEQNNLVQSDVYTFRKSLEEVFDKLQGYNSKEMSSWSPYVKGLYTLIEEFWISFNYIQKKRFINYYRLYNLGSCEQAEFKSKGLKYNNFNQLIEVILEF